MIFRIFASKDTFISNVQKSRVQQTGSNFGGSETLDLFKIAGTSGTIGVSATSSLARVLLSFNLSSITALTASGEAPSTGIRYFLKLRHATTSETLPSSFDVKILPITTDWDEGRGIDVDDFTDKGVANWIRAKSNSYWTTAGGDFNTAVTASYHFDTGYEDIDLEVTDIVDAWLSGTITNYGLAVKLTDAVEADSYYTDLYIKRFYGRTSNAKDRRPYLEARWDDSVKDSRGFFVWNRTGSLFLYNRVDGQLTALSVGSNFPIVRIADASGTLLSVTASATSRTGIYSASFALPSGSYSGSLFYDLWGSGSYAFMTGTFMFKTEGSSQVIETQQYTAKIKNLRNEYETTDSPRLNVFFRTRSYTPSTILTASADVTPKIIRKGYYSVENDATHEKVVEFGTGTIESTRLSYDENGNFFNMKMSNFHPGNVYRIFFLIDEDGQRQTIDGSFKFKVT